MARGKECGFSVECLETYDECFRQSYFRNITRTGVEKDACPQTHRNGRPPTYWRCGIWKPRCFLCEKSLIGRSVSGQDADDDIVANLPTLRDRSRDLYMGGGFAAGALKTIRTNVVGSGLMLSALPDAKFLGLSDDEARAWRENVEREWNLFASDVNCDAERRQNFYQLQSLVLLSAIMSGDVFVYMPIIKRAGVPYDLCIGLIEADRVCDPIPYPVGKNVWGGVELGQYGETVAYYVAKYHPGSTLPLNVKSPLQEWKRVLAFGRTTGRKNVLHIMCDVERPAHGGAAFRCLHPLSNP